MKTLCPLRWTLLVVTFSLSAAAQADCKPVIDALEKSAKQPRAAYYDVKGPDKPPAGRAMMVRIEKVVWINTFGASYEREEGTYPDLGAANQLRDLEKRGKSKCEPAGSGSVRGAAVSKYRFGDLLSKEARVIWVDNASGLPVYDEIPSLGPGGQAWVFGDAVKEPGKK